MIIRNETYQPSVRVRADVIDLDELTRSTEVHGVIVDSRPLTAEEIAAYLPQPG